MQFVLELVNRYGYTILFGSMVFELIGFPLPGEFMMTYCGYLVYETKMNWTVSILMAFAGVASGITISYFIGSRLGIDFFRKNGSHFHMGPERLEKTSKWFQSYGNKLLMAAYFIPGIRHITGYFSGITGISYKKFAINAYIGAFIWTSTFISLGKALGPNWSNFHGDLKRYSVIGGLIICLTLLLMYSYRNHKAQIIKFTGSLLSRAMYIFKSMRKIRAVIALLSITLLAFIVLLAGVIQDYLAHEFQKFDIIAAYLVSAVFSREWAGLMGGIGWLTSIKVLIPVTILAAVLVSKKYNRGFAETIFLASSVLGGEVVQFILRQLFRRTGPYASVLAANKQYTFPGDMSFMSFAAYGFYTFLIIYHTRKTWIRYVSVFLTIIICVFSGLSPIFFGTQYPSDVYAGYIFGGLWLTMNIIWLEINDMLGKMKS